MYWRAACESSARRASGARTLVAACRSAISSGMRRYCSWLLAMSSASSLLRKQGGRRQRHTRDASPSSLGYWDWHVPYDTSRDLAES